MNVFTNVLIGLVTVLPVISVTTPSVAQGVDHNESVAIQIMATINVSRDELMAADKVAHKKLLSVTKRCFGSNKGNSIINCILGESRSVKSDPRYSLTEKTIFAAKLTNSFSRYHDESIESLYNKAHPDANY